MGQFEVKLDKGILGEPHQFYSIVKGENLGDSKRPGMYLEKRKKEPPLLSSGNSMAFLESGHRRAANKRCLEAESTGKALGTHVNLVS